MGLKGSLRDFGISEILQLIGGQRRTGRLEVSTDLAHYQVLISGGKIVRVLKEPELKDETLEYYLLNAGLISQNQLKLALQKAKSELKPLEAVLVEMGFISPSDLKNYIFLRHLDLLYQLFLVKDGEYEFEAEPVNYHPAYGVEIETEQVLMEGYRIKDEWGISLEKIGSLESIFQKSLPEAILEETLSSEQAKVYELVNGKRTISEIALLAQSTRFDTIKILAELIQLKKIEPKIVAEPLSLREKQTVKVISQVVFSILLLLLLVLLGEASWRYYRNPERLLGKVIFEPSWKEERIRQGLEVYRLEQGDYPKQLSNLRERGILEEEDLKLGENLSYYYQEGGYQIQSPRP